MDSFWSILLQSIRNIYDEIGFVVLASVAWFFALFTIILIGPVMAGIYYLFFRLHQKKEVKALDLLEGIKRYWWKGLSFILLYLFLLVVILSNILFCINHTNPYIQLLALLWFYPLLLLLLISLFYFPALMEFQKGVFETIKRSALIVLDNFLMALGLGVFLLFFLVLSIIIPPLFMLVLGGGSAMIGTRLFSSILEKYS